ncbi:MULTISPECIES: hypothetical protein [unclassified Mesorhizobium]|uniref:hypothetical protein n=1 Tax=unclassified Mesorhizobium TaxID=325217 RepID=UPI000FCC77CE|nr:MULTISPECIES: hypothetical protein [unclassified Mesorhizobium]RUU59021.1 hypothetical protein EOC99_23365 [Mesorhizobium sp. M7A.T.Ca.TU.009.01.1.1]RUU81523.1 hypothetical protein EOD03_17265 [Mesorhizobium sp. M7A.T.Ca.TU.009.01.1.2]RUT88116.1 hypothetical protein EOD14_07890 [Mesorhizobium sp. M7A.T.Ca.US.000.02.1.1]RUT91877.1 hypothetical protein EOD15_12935 [Mesorhizobium sp. M7A.T.Ca.US.000.02.2.1]RUU01004.1 hypothetical protein EOD12_17440 [Mesorhizobium sp. M7A.T.Ca.TU.009.02.1.1]
MADVYLQTYRKGGGRRGGGLIALSKFIDQIPADDRLRVLEKLDDTGLWQIVYRHISREGKKIRIGGFVKAYLGDEEE